MQILSPAWSVEVVSVSATDTKNKLTILHKEGVSIHEMRVEVPRDSGVQRLRDLRVEGGGDLRYSVRADARLTPRFLVLLF